MFDNEMKLFCYKMRRTSEGLEREGTSYRYTIMSLLGLYKYESVGMQSPINIQDTLKTLVDRSREINNVGDLGLLLWLCALAAPEKVGQIFVKVDKNNILDKYSDGRQGKATELAWILAGLSHSALASGKNIKEFENLAIQTVERIKKSYGGKGIFGHMNNATLRGMIRGRIGCFADQV